MGVLTHFLLWNLGLAKPWTWYSEEECRALEHYARGKKILVEIGCWHGVNTARLRQGMNPNGVLYAIDPYPRGRLGFSAAKMIAQKTVSKIPQGKVIWLPLTDLQAADYFKTHQIPAVDFIFSDALNTYEGLQNTWEAWIPHLKVGGILVIANSHSTPQKPLKAGSIEFTDKVIKQDSRFQMLEQPGCFTIVQKIHET